jgi:integrase
MSLTVKRVAKLIRHGQPGRHLDGTGGDGVRGLYLCVENRSNASWTLRYQLGGKAHWMGLGSARTLTLDMARERAKAARLQLLDKTDPLQARRAEHAAKTAAAAKRLTFKEAAEEYIEDHRSKWKSAVHGRQWLTTLAQYAYPIIGTLDVAQVDRPAVLRVLEQQVPAQRGNPAGKLWKARLVTADRLRNRIELVLARAQARGHRPSGENPAAWAGLKHILPKPAKSASVEHHKAVPYVEVPALMAQLRQHEGVAVQALQFVTLTACRVGEVLGATWDEIDLDNAVWTIPAGRMKAGREHKVPLSPPAIALLRGLYREAGNRHLFIGARNAKLSNAALLAALRRLGRSETAHGFRSSFSDWAHERSAFSNHVIELSLAHAIGSAAEQAYRRGDMFEKRRKLMQAWATFCTTAPARGSAQVVAINEPRQ